MVVFFLVTASGLRHLHGGGSCGSNRNSDSGSGNESSSDVEKIRRRACKLGRLVSARCALSGDASLSLGRTRAVGCDSRGQCGQVKATSETACAQTIAAV